jgi:LysM repeat protein
VHAAEDWRRYAAPAAFLLAVTVAVVLVRLGLEHDSNAPAASTAAVSSTNKTTVPAKKFWVVRAGDTFGVISAKTGVPVARIEQLNPNASSTTLFIGERIKLK